MDKLRPDTPKKQHYVPQLLLKNFAYGKKHKIFSFDKSEARSFGTNVRDSASENGFYNLQIDSEEHTLEHKLSKLEGICSSVVKKICRYESLENITRDERLVLCVFVANLLLRVKKQRIFFEQLNASMAEWLKGMGLELNEVQNFETLGKEDIEKQHIEFTHEHVLECSKRFHNKPIALLKAPNGCHFIISDNPVAMYNHWPQELRGDKGISVPGVEIQVPLSKKLCLSFVCPQLYSDLDEKLDFITARRAQNLPIENIDTSYAEVLISSIKEGKAIEVNPENVKFTNSLQIADSLNYIYSDKNDFRLAEEMLRKNPDLANGKVMWMGI
jgi:hypothetical protein